jgi:hypothetical protein
MMRDGGTLDKMCILKPFLAQRTLERSCAGHSTWGPTAGTSTRIGTSLSSITSWCTRTVCTRRHTITVATFTGGHCCWTNMTTTWWSAWTCRSCKTKQSDLDSILLSPDINFYTYKEHSERALYSTWACTSSGLNSIRYKQALNNHLIFKNVWLFAGTVSIADIMTCWMRHGYDDVGDKMRNWSQSNQYQPGWRLENHERQRQLINDWNL